MCHLRSVYADGAEHNRYPCRVRERHDGCGWACARFSFILGGNDTARLSNFAKFYIIKSSRGKRHGDFLFLRKFHGGKFRFVAIESQKALTKIANSYKIYNDIL